MSGFKVTEGEPRSEPLPDPGSQKKPFFLMRLSVYLTPWPRPITHSFIYFRSVKAFQY